MARQRQREQAAEAELPARAAVEKYAWSGAAATRCTAYSSDATTITLSAGPIQRRRTVSSSNGHTR